jgi:hypothetical protein
VNKSDSIKNLAEALCLAQSEMGGASKDSKNPFFKSSYADLGSVVAAIKEPFANNGLSYTQFPIEEGGRIGVETMLMHKSGEWLSNSFTVAASKQDAQGAGSALTYTRRYALQSIAGIPSEDDDGNSASSQSSKTKSLADINPADISKFMSLDNEARNKKWPTLSPALKEAINKASANA